MARLDSNLHESLNEEIIKILYSKKIYTTIDFINSDIKFLSNITPLSYKNILEIQKLISKKFSAKIQTGAELYDELLKTARIPTFIKSLDKLLNGGLLSDNIYELCGYASSGKTQLCLTLAINIVQNLEKPILYIDTKRDFSGKRVQNILDARNCNEEISAKILNEIKIKQINTRYELLSILHEIKDVKSGISNIKFVIIDSLPSIFYHIGDLNNNLINMNHFVNIMRYLAKEMKICFLITNILLKNQNLLSTTNSEKPGLGAYWQSIPDFRFILTKNDDFCDITLIKSIDLPKNSCQVQITNSGVL